MSRNTSLAAPLVVENSGRWLGNDGQWSTFYIHVGTPPQTFHVLPSLNGQTIYIPIDKDCERLNTTNCGDTRGVEIFASRPSSGFHPVNSTSWNQMGTYRVGLGTNFGILGNGIFGNDTAGLGTSGTPNAVTLENQAIVAYATPDIWVGQLGLSQYALNLSDTVTPHSFLSRLKEGGHIPSLSFGYQAGAFYRYTRVPSSLILGGYDRSRISGPSLQLSSESDFIVGLQSISATTPNGTVTFLLASGIVATLDTAVSELWLPPTICDAFAAAFGLTYFEAADRYALTDTAHKALLAAPPIFKFTVGVSAIGGESIVIEIPYAAFDLQANYPIFAGPTNYFPLRRAANATQYALGRAFMQEIYLSIDLERDEFNVSQALFMSSMPEPNIVKISPKEAEKNILRLHSAAHKLSTAAIAGIAVGIALVILLLTGSSCWFLRRRSKIRAIEGKIAKELEAQHSSGKIETKFELDNGIFPELHSPHGESEMHYDSTEKRVNMKLVEVEGSSPIFELPSPSEIRRKV